MSSNDNKKYRNNDIINVFCIINKKSVSLVTLLTKKVVT